MKWIIVDHTFCIWLGAVWKCDYGIHMSFIGLMVAMYSLTMSISMQYMDLPPLMIFREIDLNAFRLGLWWPTTLILWNWFLKKLEKEAGKKILYIDVDILRIQRIRKFKTHPPIDPFKLSEIAGSWRWTIRFICLNLMIRIFEIFIKSVKKNF